MAVLHPNKESLDGRIIESTDSQATERPATIIKDWFPKPNTFDAFVGQPSICRFLKKSAEVCNQTGIEQQPMFFSGPAHSGKQCLASIYAQFQGSHLVVCNALDLQNGGDLAEPLTHLGKGDVLYISHIDKLNSDLVSLITTAATIFRVTVKIDEGEDAKLTRLNLPRFSLILASEVENPLLPESIRDIIVFEAAFTKYTKVEVAHILVNSCAHNGIGLYEDASLLIAETAQSEPSMAAKLLRWVITYSLASKVNLIDKTMAEEALSMIPTAPIPIT